MEVGEVEGEIHYLDLEGGAGEGAGWGRTEVVERRYCVVLLMTASETGDLLRGFEVPSKGEEVGGRVQWEVGGEEAYWKRTWVEEEGGVQV